MKKSIVCLGIFFLVMITGCENKSEDKNDYLSYNNTKLIEENSDAELQGDNQISSLKEEDNEKTVPKEKTVKTHYTLDNRFQSILQVYQINGKTKILAFNEKKRLFLYNITDDKLYSYQFKKHKKKDWNNYKIFSCQEKILFSTDITKMDITEKKEVEGLKITAGRILDEKKWIYVFDQKLKINRKYNFSDISETITAITLDEKKGFVATDNHNIYCYSLNHGKGKILSHKILSQLKDITIEEMQMNESQNMIAFLGCKLNQNKYDVYGWIDLVNKTVKIQCTENAYGNCLHIEKNIAYITDGEIPRKHMATGVIKCMNLSSKKFFDFKVDNLESTAACLSKDGSQLFTYRNILSEDNETIIGSWVCIYDFSNGEILYENKWENDGIITGVYSCDKRFYVTTGKKLSYIEV